MVNEKRMLDLILRENRLGWWVKEDSKSIITISEYAKTTLGLPSKEIGYAEFAAMVRDDYRDRITKELSIIDLNVKFDQVFPLNAPNGTIWVHVKELDNKIRNKYIVATGKIEFIDNPEIHAPQQATTLRTTNLLTQLHSVSEILLSFLLTENPDQVVQDILKDILKQFKAGRAYIFEYDFQRKTQSNTYEAVDEHIQPEIDKLTDLPFTQNRWWGNQIIKKKEPIILSTLDDLPPEAAPEKEFLAAQDINSLFVAPLLSKDGAWGYVGVDIVDGFHTWTKEDIVWLKAMFNIVSLCIQLQRSETAVKREKAYLENLYKNMPLGYLRVQLLYNKKGEIADYTFVDSNPAADKLFGKPLAKQMGKKASAILNKQLLKKNFDYLRQVISHKNYIETDYYIDRTNKHTRLVMYSIHENEVICLFSDMTDSHQKSQKLIKAKEKAEVSDKLKSAFLANMSHEIRTPLNSIIGFSDLITETEDAEERRTYSEIVHKNNDLLLQLISDILDISKIEAGTLDVVYGDVDVNQMFTEIIHTYDLKTQNNSVKVTIEKTMPTCRIYSDKNRLIQVMSNFINNALKFTNEGSITIGYYPADKDKIKFYVQDTGCGIAEDKLKNVFERFVKLDSFMPGTGLGLPICKSLIEQMGGEIGVDSELGKGSCFWFTLPFTSEKSQSKPTRTTQKRKEEPTIEDNKLTILIAEDTESNYFLLNSLLKRKYNLIRAHNGKEALRLYKKHKPDIILMDIKMPEMDGIEATGKIRKLNPTVPIIAVTAFAYDSDREKALTAGCDAYMAKPIKISELIETIEAMLNK